MSGYNVNLSLQVVPINSLNSYKMIDEAIEVIQKSGIKYEVGPFATIMEGPFEKLLEIVQEVKSTVMMNEIDELLFNIQIHMKKGRSVKMEDKTSKFN